MLHCSINVLCIALWCVSVMVWQMGNWWSNGAPLILIGLVIRLLIRYASRSKNFFRSWGSRIFDHNVIEFKYFFKNVILQLFVLYSSYFRSDLIITSFPYLLNFELTTKHIHLTATCKGLFLQTRGKKEAPLSEEKMNRCCLTK